MASGAGYNNRIEFEWDGAKAAANILNHKVTIDGKLAPPAGVTPTVTCDADIANVFKNAAAVNTVLRIVIRMADDGTDAGQDTKEI